MPEVGEEGDQCSADRAAGRAALFPQRFPSVRLRHEKPADARVFAGKRLHFSPTPKILQAASEGGDGPNGGRALTSDKRSARPKTLRLWTAKNECTRDDEGSRNVMQRHVYSAPSASALSVSPVKPRRSQKSAVIFRRWFLRTRCET
jgi:hypothetical protein